MYNLWHCYHPLLCDFKPSYTPADLGRGSCFINILTDKLYIAQPISGAHYKTLPNQTMLEPEPDFLLGFKRFVPFRCYPSLALPRCKQSNQHTPPFSQLQTLRCASCLPVACSECAPLNPSLADARPYAGAYGGLSGELRYRDVRLSVQR